jgi:hypothetical protein
LFDSCFQDEDDLTPEQRKSEIERLKAAHAADEGTLDSYCLGSSFPRLAFNCQAYLFLKTILSVDCVSILSLWIQNFLTKWTHRLMYLLVNGLQNTGA